jgi:predicted nuclease with RNAse H fold
MTTTPRVLGIDLSGRTTGRTSVALAVGDGGAGRPEVELVREAGGARLGLRPELRRLADVAVALRVDLVAIDAPLTLPHVWTCDDPNCAECFPPSGEDGTYTIRPCEDPTTWATQTSIAARPMPTSLLGALAVRGAYLKRALDRVGLPALETWPAGTLLQLAGPGARKPSSSTDAAAYVGWARNVLAPRVTTDWAEVACADDVDAIAAAYAGWVHATGRAGACQHLGAPDPICIPSG